MMTLQEAIRARHSVRHYISRPIGQDILQTLDEEINRCNREGQLHIQLVCNEPKGFGGLLAYGSFSGVENYLVMAGRKADDLDERIGYYGERLVLLAQQLGLSTCWAGLSYRKVKGACTLGGNEKIAAMIALGYGADGGREMKKKSVEALSNAGDATPDWFRRGMESVRLAPSAVNQQKYHFEYLAPQGNALPRVKARKGFSVVGYTQMDLGIAKFHFEAGAGRADFEWA